MSAPDYVPAWDRIRSGIAAERVMLRVAAEAHECPSCGAGIGEHCINAVTGRPLSDRCPAHPARSRVARDAGTYRTEHTTR